MATPWGSLDHTLPGRWARGYATAGGALAVGVLVGGVVGLVGAQTCTAEGFACLGWLVGGLQGRQRLAPVRRPRRVVAPCCSVSEPDGGSETGWGSESTEHARVVRSTSSGPVDWTTRSV